MTQFNIKISWKKFLKLFQATSQNSYMNDDQYLSLQEL